MIKIPKDFTNCVNSGGKVITKNLKGNRYVHICYDKKGNSYAGEIKKKKAKARKLSKKEKLQKKIKESRILAEKLIELKNHFDENYHEK